MTNSYYNPTGSPLDHSAGVALSMRNEFSLIQTGFQYLSLVIDGFAGAALVTATDIGTASAHVLMPSTAVLAYTPFMTLMYLPAYTNTGACTVNVSGLGAKNIVHINQSTPTAGDIIAGQVIELVYDGTNFVNACGFLMRTGNQVLNGNLSVTGTLGVTGNTTVGGTLGVTSNSTVGGTLGVTGNTTVGGTFAVTNQTTLQNATGVTVTTGDNTIKLATTAFVTTATANEAAIRLANDNTEITLRTAADLLLAPLAGANFTGTVSVLYPVNPTDAAQRRYVDNAISASGSAPAWISGNTYLLGSTVYSPSTFLTYRHITTTSNLTDDPSIDLVNWMNLGGRNKPHQPLIT